MDAFEPIPFQRTTGVGNSPDQKSPAEDRSYPVFLSGGPRVWGKPDSHLSVRSRTISGLDAIKKQVSVTGLSLQHLRALEGQVTSQADRENALAIVDELLENLDRISETASAQINQLFNIVRRKNTDTTAQLPINKPTLDAASGSGIWQHLNNMKENLLLLREEFQIEDLCHEKQSHFIDQIIERGGKLSSQAGQLETALQTVRSSVSKPLDRPTVKRALAAWVNGERSEPAFLQKSWLFIKRLPLKIMALLSAPFVLMEKISSLSIAVFDGAFSCLCSDSTNRGSIETALRDNELAQSRLRHERTKSDSAQTPGQKVVHFTERAQQVLVANESDESPGMDQFDQLKQQRQQAVQSRTDQARESFERRLSRSDIKGEPSGRAKHSISETREKITEQHREAVLRTHSSGLRHHAQEEEKEILEDLNWHLVNEEVTTASTSVQSHTKQMSFKDRINEIDQELSILLLNFEPGSDLRELELRLSLLNMKLAAVKADVYTKNEELFDGELLEQHLGIRAKIKNGETSLRQLWLQVRNLDGQSCLRHIRADLTKLRDELVAERAGTIRIDAIEKTLSHLRKSSIDPDFWPELNRLLNMEGSKLHQVVYRYAGSIDAYAEQVCQAKLQKLIPLRVINDYISPQSLITAVDNFMDGLPSGSITREQVLKDCPEIADFLDNDEQALVKIKRSVASYFHHQISSLQTSQAFQWGNPGKAASIQLLIQKFRDFKPIMEVLQTCPNREIKRVFCQGINLWLEQNYELKASDFYNAVGETRRSKTKDLSYNTLFKEVRIKMSRDMTFEEQLQLEQIYCNIIAQVRAEFCKK